MAAKKINLEDLKQELPYKWRVQSTKFGKASCVAYIDARDAMNLLDKVLGPENWGLRYYEEAGLLFCSVGINVGLDPLNPGGWVWKSDTGSESNVEKDKGHASDAFKRACVHWGIGRFLYDLEIIKLDTQDYKGKPYPYFKPQDKVLFSGDDITKVCNYLTQKDKKKNDIEKI